MFLRKRVKFVEEDIIDIEEDLKGSFENVRKDFRATNDRIDSWGKQHNILAKDLQELKEELATNGVVSRLAKLQKEFKLLQNNFGNLDSFVVRKFRELEQNGVATSINKLNAEVFKSQKEVKNELSSFIGLFGGVSVPTIRPETEPTLAGKVDAIVEHLGLDLTVKPAETTPAKVVAKKKAAPKKRRRY